MGTPEPAGAGCPTWAIAARPEPSLPDVGCLCAARCRGVCAPSLRWPSGLAPQRAVPTWSGAGGAVRAAWPSHHQAGWLVPRPACEAVVSGDGTENGVQRCCHAQGALPHGEGPRWEQPAALQGPASPLLARDLAAPESLRGPNCGKLCLG